MADFDIQTYSQTETYPPIMWDTLQNVEIGASFNEMLQAPEYFPNIENTDDFSSYSSSSPRSPSSRPSNASTEVKSSVPDKVERRREQNRQSQRAYRDRKEKHQRELEIQIAQWRDKHKKLADSFTAQTKEVRRLKAQVDTLNSQITTLRAGVPVSWNQHSSMPQDFDLVPFQNRSPHSRSLSVWDQPSPGTLSSN